MHDEILKAILDTATSTNQKVDRIEDQLTRLETCQISHSERLNRLDKVVLFGNGQPPIIKQIEQVHHTRDFVASLDARLTDELRAMNTRIDSNKNLLWGLVIVLVGAVLGGLLLGGKK